MEDQLKGLQVSKHELEYLKACVSKFDTRGLVYGEVFPVVNRLQQIIQSMEAEVAAQQNAVMNVSASENSSSAASIFPITISRLGSLSSNEEILFIFLHCLMLKCGFICTVEIPSTVPGFAAVIREIPKGRYIHDGWNANKSNMIAWYKHKKLPGRKISLRMVSDYSTAVIEYTVIGTGSESLQVDMGSLILNTFPEEYSNLEKVTNAINFDLLGFLSGIILNNQEIESELLRLIGKASSVVFDNINQPKPPTAPVTGSATSMDSISQQTIYSSVRSPQIIKSTNPYEVGRDDLNPPGTFVDPSSLVGPFHIPAGSSGSLVGPNHPMFNDPQFPSFGEGGSFPGYGSIPGLPQPRFDPFGPVTGPFGPDVGNVGLPNGPNGGQRRQPGEPDPDHLPPPGNNSDFPGNPRPNLSRGRFI